MDWQIGFLELLVIQGVNTAFLIGGMYAALRNLIKRVDKHEVKMERMEDRITQCMIGNLTNSPDNRGVKKSHGYYYND